MAMMPSGTSGNPYEDDHDVFNDDFLNDGTVDDNGGRLACIADLMGRYRTRRTTK